MKCYGTKENNTKFMPSMPSSIVLNFSLPAGKESESNDVSNAGK